MRKIWNFLRNRWVKFAIVALVYTLWFVVWTGNLWLLLGLPVIYDIYISKLLYRLVWRRHKDHKARSRRYKVTAEWIEAIVFATVAATLIRIFFFEMYVIPSPSMEKTLLVGDYLCVSKVAYGPKMPNTPLSFPFVHHTMPFSQTRRSFSEIIRWPYHRLKGFGHPQHNDVVVFNFPAGDTVILENQQISYYDVLREFQNAYGEQQGRKMLQKQYHVISRPVDKRENYIKRLIGMPGDTIRIVASQVTVNGVEPAALPGLQYVDYIQTNGSPISAQTFEDMGVTREDINYNNANQTYRVPLTEDMVQRVRKFRNVLSVRKEEATRPSPAIFPHSPLYPWNEDNFGPLWVPSKGSTVQLTLENLPLYARIIETYEENDLAVSEGVIYINGDPADSYTFGMDYYFMMGDNRHNSADSRYWGFVPADHIVGKASFVWLSLDKDKSFPRNIRWNKMFKGIE